MKEQLFEILYNRKRMPGERFSDIEGKIENFVNQEVEKRIAERMPTENDKRIGADRLFGELTTNFKEGMYSGFFFGCDFIRSRLTCSGKPNNLKTEGGGE